VLLAPVRLLLTAVRSFHNVEPQGDPSWGSAFYHQTGSGAARPRGLGKAASIQQLLDQPLSAYWRLAQWPCCINEIDIAGGRAEILRISDTQHLAA
jgi:hypothetical protein